MSDKQTNADRIRNMSDEELAEWLTNMCDIERNEEPFKSIYNLNTEQEEEIHDSYGDLLEWLQSEAEQEIIWKIDICIKLRQLQKKKENLTMFGSLEILLFLMDCIEVIGNIFDNKDLLESEE